MKKKVVKIILIVLLFIGAAVGSYVVSYFVDQLNSKNKEAIIEVVFDDNEYYIMTNIEVLDQDNALLEWPYKFKVSNSGNTDGLYQIIIIDNKENDIKRDSLSYILFENEKEVKKGLLKDIKNDVLYETNIKETSKKEYKLYIYNNQKTEGKIYKYSIKLNAILEGGPGF